MVAWGGGMKFQIPSSTIQNRMIFTGDNGGNGEEMRIQIPGGNEREFPGVSLSLTPNFSWVPEIPGKISTVSTVYGRAAVGRA